MILMVSSYRKSISGIRGSGLTAPPRTTPQAEISGGMSAISSPRRTILNGGDRPTTPRTDTIQNPAQQDQTITTPLHCRIIGVVTISRSNRTESSGRPTRKKLPSITLAILYHTTKHIAACRGVTCDNKCPTQASYDAPTDSLCGLGGNSGSRFSSDTWHRDGGNRAIDQTAGESTIEFPDSSEGAERTRDLR